MGVRRAGAVLLAAALTMLSVTVARAAPPPDVAAKAGKYLVQRETPDGAWTSSSSTAPATADQVADGVVALVAAGVTGEPLTKAIKYVTDHGPTDANRATATAKVVLAAVATGRNPRDFGSVDYVGRLRTYYNPNNGNYDSASTDGNALAILALSAAKDPLPPAAISSLRGRQCEDGGFARTTCLLNSDVVSTSLTLDALVATGMGDADPLLGKARQYLTGVQNTDGGFGTASGQATTALPTGMLVGALVTLGEDPTGGQWKKSATANPVSALLKFQDSSGGVRADGSATAPDDFTTARVLPALAERALPVAPAAAEPATPTSAIAAPATAGGSTTTTAAPSSRTTVSAGNPASSTPTVAVLSPPARGSEQGLASPAGRSNAANRSLVGLAPFIATLFGAGALGLVLRRRART